MPSTEKPDVIVVTIPAQTYDSNKYADHQNCYLADALKAMGYGDIDVRDVDVLPLGVTYIGETRYKPKEPFGGSILRDAFAKGQSVTVTLVRNGSA